MWKRLRQKDGNRVIPMSEKVLEAFQRVLNKRKYVQPVILEGYTKFLFLNRNGLPKVAVNYESMFRGLVRKYNKTQKVALPKVMTPHTLRHTFCTTLANAGMNPKALQYIMGHSNINMTLNYYAHTTSETSITRNEAADCIVVNGEFTTPHTTFEHQNIRGYKKI